MAKQQVENTIPDNKPIRKPTGKKEFSLGGFKKLSGCGTVPDKSLEWIKLSKGFQEATGLPGIPKGYVTLSRGFSNTGKSTSLCEGIVSAQKMGILPIIIDTENNMGRKRLENMGFDWGDDDDNGFYIIVKNKYLLDNFGKKQNKDRTKASIEDLEKCIEFFIREQELGNLPYDLHFAIDSIGTLNCIKTIDAKETDSSSNNMWNAAAYEKCFLNLLNDTIPFSRRVDSPYTNTIHAVQKIWIDNMNGGGIKHKGGETFYFGARLIFHHGGQVSHGTKKINATSKNREVNYGMESKVGVAKNHIDGPLGGISMEGKLISTPHGFVYTDNINEYKKQNILYFRNLFDDDTLTADDISFKITNAGDDDKVNNKFVETLDYEEPEE